MTAPLNEPQSHTQPCQVLLVDVDGTLIDSFPGIRACFVQALFDVGWPVPDEEFIAGIAGPPMEETLRSLGMPEGLVPTALQTYLRHYGESGWNNAHPFDGAAEFLQWAHSEGIFISTATSKGEGFARQALTEFGLIEEIDFLAAAEENGARRTKRAVLDYAMAHLPTADSYQMALLGDRIHDIDGARYSGATAIAATWGYGTSEEWDQADFQAKDFYEAKEILRARVFHL